MIKLTRRPALRRTALTAAAGAMAFVGVISTASAASASSIINATYPVTGSTYLKGPNFTLNLGPGTLDSNVNVKTGKLTAVLTLPPATGSFKQYGLIPVTATTVFINDGKTTGTIDLNTGVVTSTSKITLQITSLTVAGVPMPVGTSCETAAPVKVKVVSQPGFQILTGGNLAGSYTVGSFANCGLATTLLNLTIPGSGNTIALTLGTPTFG